MLRILASTVGISLFSTVALSQPTFVEGVHNSALATVECSTTAAGGVTDEGKGKAYAVGAAVSIFTVAAHGEGSVSVDSRADAGIDLSDDKIHRIGNQPVRYSF